MPLDGFIGSPSLIEGLKDEVESTPIPETRSQRGGRPTELPDGFSVRLPLRILYAAHNHITANHPSIFHEMYYKFFLLCALCVTIFENSVRRVQFYYCKSLNHFSRNVREIFLLCALCTTYFENLVRRAQSHHCKSRYQFFSQSHIK